MVCLGVTIVYYNILILVFFRSMTGRFQDLESELPSWVARVNSAMPRPTWWSKRIQDDTGGHRGSSYDSVDFKRSHFIWLVVGEKPLWKMMEFVNWDDEIPFIYGKIKFMATSHHQPVIHVHRISVDKLDNFSLACSIQSFWTLNMMIIKGLKPNGDPTGVAVPHVSDTRKPNLVVKNMAQL